MMKILNKLDMYSLNEGFLDKMKQDKQNEKNNQNLIKEFINKVETTLPNKLSDCKKAKVSYAKRYDNAFSIDIYFNNKHDTEELHSLRKQAMEMINSIASAINPKFVDNYNHYKIAFAETRETISKKWAKLLYMYKEGF